MTRLGFNGLAIFLMAALLGCDNYTTPKPIPPPTLNNITVSPVTPSVSVGSTQSFTAMGNFSNNSTTDVTSTVTWSSSTPSVATISSAGVATGVAAGSTTISAKSGSITGTTTLTVTSTGNATRIKISPIGPAINANHSEAFTATEVFSDGSTQVLTSGVNWTSSNTGAATIGVTTGVATGVAAGLTTITATFGSLSDSTALDVLPAANFTPSMDSGNYVFSVESADARGPQFTLGRFHANAADSSGNGTIDTGAEDVNTSTGVLQNVALTGTYTIFPDLRGDLTLTPDPASGLPPISFRFALFNDFEGGKMIEFDGLGTAKGQFVELVGGTPTIAASSTYVFRLGGSSITGAGKPLGEVGAFASDASANFVCAPSTCSVDANDNGSVTTKAALSVSNFVAPDVNGRGTVTLGYTNAASAPVTANFAYYPAGGNQNEVFLIETDTGNMALAGIAEQQFALGHNNFDFDLDYSVAMEQPPAVAGPGGLAADRTEFNSMIHWTPDGSGLGQIINGETDVNGSLISGITGTYNVSGTLGRGILAESSSPNRTFTFYLSGSNDTAFFLDTSDANAAVGTGDRISNDSFSIFNNPLLGSGFSPYVAQLSALTKQKTEVLTLLNGDGAGSVSGVADLAIAGNAPTSVIIIGSYTNPPNPNPDALGRGQINPGSGNPIAPALAIYGIDDTHGFILGQPDLEGTINVQPD